MEDEIIDSLGSDARAKEHQKLLLIILSPSKVENKIV
jgi:hypothetical protein